MKITASKLVLMLAVTGMIAGAEWAARGEAAAGDKSQEVELGARLFNDDRFCSPKGDLRNSCASCHMSDQGPEGPRAYTDFLTRSWVPWRTGLRNAPTIFDLSDAPRLHYDGEFTSLEGLARGTLTGRSMGWLRGEESDAAA